LNESVRSGLAVLDVTIPTGYIVQQQDLDAYIRSRRVHNLQRARFLERSVLFYFDYVSVLHIYRVRQKYLMILQKSCEWNCLRGEFVLERSSSETQSISVAMERWSVEHWAFAVEIYLKNNDSVVVTQLIFCRHFNIHRNECP
jgi:hypothetical protein